MRETLRVINESIEASDAVAWKLSEEAAETIQKAEDTREGVTAFFEKRAPRWKGR